MPGDIVPHPRYGDRSLPSGSGIDPEEVAASWLHSYNSRQVYPDSAIRADISRQRYLVYPRWIYVDVLRTCRDCRRDFIFFAREQRHWYEDLGFHVHADCVRCVECRSEEHGARHRHRRYSLAIVRDDLDDVEFATMIEDAARLFESGFIKSQQRLRRLKNLAVARLPGSSATAAIVAAVERG